MRARRRPATAARASLVRAENPDAVILATGSRLHKPPFEGSDAASNVVHAADVFAGRAKTGSNVVVYDWLADWICSGVAEKLASEGAYVRLAVNGICPAVNIQNYVRDVYIAKLHRLGVTVLPMMRLYGVEDRTVYFLHTAAQEPVILEDVDTVVLACPNAPRDDLADELRDVVKDLYLVGDCLTPRTAEEAVFEGLKAGLAV